jgi:hypothetical protein
LCSENGFPHLGEHGHRNLPAGLGLLLSRRQNHGPYSVFRLPESFDPSYRLVVTTPTEVRIAGVPWPTYKLVALAVGMIVLVIVDIATATVGPAVVAAAAATTVVWLALSVFSHDNR